MIINNLKKIASVITPVSVGISMLILGSYFFNEYEKKNEEKKDILQRKGAEDFTYSIGIIIDNLKIGKVEETGNVDLAREKTRNILSRLENLLSNPFYSYFLFSNKQDKNKIKEMYFSAKQYLTISQMNEQIYYIQTGRKKIEDFKYKNMDELKKNYSNDYMKQYPNLNKFVLNA